MPFNPRWSWLSKCWWKTCASVLESLLLHSSNTQWVLQDEGFSFPSRFSIKKGNALKLRWRANCSFSTIFFLLQERSWTISSHEEQRIRSIHTLLHSLFLFLRCKILRAIACLPIRPHVGGPCVASASSCILWIRNYRPEMVGGHRFVPSCSLKYLFKLIVS